MWVVYLLKAAHSGLSGNNLPEEQRHPTCVPASVALLNRGSQGHGFLRTGVLLLPQEEVYFLCQSYNHRVGEFLNE